MKTPRWMFLAAPLALLSCDREPEGEPEPVPEPAVAEGVQPPQLGPSDTEEPAQEDESAAELATRPVMLVPGPTITDRTLEQTRSGIDEVAHELGGDLGPDTGAEPRFEPGGAVRLDPRARAELAALERNLTRPYAERDAFDRVALETLYATTMAARDLDELGSSAAEVTAPDFERSTRALATEILAARRLVDEALSSSESEWSGRSAEAREAVLEVQRHYQGAVRALTRT